MAEMVASGRSLVVAADAEPHMFSWLVGQVAGADGVSAVKLGPEVAFELKLRHAVEEVHQNGLLAVYDHMSAGIGAPEEGVSFARLMNRANVDAATLYPLGGPDTQRVWTQALLAAGVRVITGSEMSHDNFRSSVYGDGGGYVAGPSFRRIFELALELGGRDFIVPGDKPDRVKAYRAFFDARAGAGGYTLWVDNAVDSEGMLRASVSMAGLNVNAIAGNTIYESPLPRQTAMRLGQKMLQLGAAE